MSWTRSWDIWFESVYISAAATYDIGSLFFDMDTYDTYVTYTILLYFIYIYIYTRIHIIYNIYEILWDRHDVAIYGNRLNDWTTGAKPGRWPLDSGRLAVLRWSLPVFHSVGPWIKHNDESSMKHKYHKYRIISITISLRWWQIFSRSDRFTTVPKIWEILSSKHQIFISFGQQQPFCARIFASIFWTEMTSPRSMQSIRRGLDSLDILNHR